MNSSANGPTESAASAERATGTARPMAGRTRLAEFVNHLPASWSGPADRDTGRRPDADEFLVERPPRPRRRHLSFGSGPRSCIGAGPARPTIRISLRVAPARLPGPPRSGRAGARIDDFFGCIRYHLPVAWEA